MRPAQGARQDRRGGGAAGAVRRDPPVHRPAARPASAGDVIRQNRAVGEAKGRVLRRRSRSGPQAAPTRPPGGGRRPPSPQAPPVGGSCRPKKDRRCAKSHRQGCDPRPMLSRRTVSGNTGLGLKGLDASRVRTTGRFHRAPSQATASSGPRSGQQLLEVEHCTGTPASALAGAAMMPVSKR
jgi:hypothetical protein